MDGNSLDLAIGQIVGLGEAQVSIQGINLNSEVSEVSSAGDAQFAFDGIELDGTVGDVFALGAAQASAESIQLDTLFSEVSGSGYGQFQLDGSILDFEIAEIYSAGDGQSELNGIILDLEIGEVTATAESSDDAVISISGIQILSFVGNVATNVLNDEIFQLSGNPKRYSANQFKSGNVKLTGIETKISTGNVKAIGVMSLSVRVALETVGLSARMPTISANGVLSISDEEFLLLMAA